MESWQQENHIECWVWWNLEFAPIYKTRGGPWEGTLLADERFWQVHITDQNVSSAHISKRCLSRRSGRVHSGWWWLLPNAQCTVENSQTNPTKCAQNAHKSERISKRRGLSGREHSGWWWIPAPLSLSTVVPAWGEWKPPCVLHNTNTNTHKLFSIKYTQIQI